MDIYTKFDFLSWIILMLRSIPGRCLWRSRRLSGLCILRAGAWTRSRQNRNRHLSHDRMMCIGNDRGHGRNSPIASRHLHLSLWSGLCLTLRGDGVCYRPWSAKEWDCRAGVTWRFHRRWDESGFPSDSAGSSSVGPKALRRHRKEDRVFPVLWKYMSALLVEKY